MIVRESYFSSPSFKYKRGELFGREVGHKNRYKTPNLAFLSIQTEWKNKIFHLLLCAVKLRVIQNSPSAVFPKMSNFV